MKKYSILMLNLIMVVLLVSGCGTTVSETFDEVPVTASAVTEQTGLPVTSKIDLTISAPNVTFTGADTSAEAGSEVKIYDEAEVLLAAGTADGNGAFNIVFNNTIDSTFLLSATAVNKLESNSVMFVKM